MPIAACAYAATVAGKIYVFVFGKVRNLYRLDFDRPELGFMHWLVPTPVENPSRSACTSTTLRRTRIMAGPSCPSRSGTASPPRWQETGAPLYKSIALLKPSPPQSACVGRLKHGVHRRWEFHILLLVLAS
jgi:hypothetical protein